MIHKRHTRQPVNLRQSRRGMAVAVIVVVMAALSLAVAGSVRPARQEADVASLRVQTVRAFYAADSGIAVLIGTIQSGLDAPDAGDTIVWGLQSAEFELVDTDAVTVIGRSGQAERRVTLEFE
ncbi:MAG: hypothetical protein AAGA55_02050 [Planctomycetota bacterium]